MDYTNLFGSGGFQVDPSLALTPTASTGGVDDLTRLLAMIAGKAGSALSTPGSIGDVMGKGAVQMAQASGVNKGGTTPTAPTPTAAPQANPLDTAKSYSKMGSMLKDAFALNPSLIPDGYKDEFSRALSLNPSQMQNPTVPAPAASEPPAAGVAPQVQPQQEIVPRLSEALAMTLSPEQVTGLQNFAVTKSAEERARALNPVDIAERQARTQHYGDLRAYQQWQMDPQRVEDAIRQNTAPVLAQFENLKKTNQLTRDNIATFISNNPGIASMKLPGGMTVGQQAELSAANPDMAKNIGGLIERGIAYEAAKYTADKHLQAVRASADATGQIRQFTIDSQMYEKANADIAKWEAAPTAESWAKMQPTDRMMAAAKGITGPRTPALQDAINKAKTMRDAIGTKLYGPSYSKLRDMEEKSGGGADIVVTPEQLKGMTEGQRATTTSHLPEFMKMFSNQAIGPYISDHAILGTIQNPVPSEEHPITKYLRGGGEL